MHFSLILHRRKKIVVSLKSHLVLVFCTLFVVLDGFDEHYQASFHFSLTINVDKFQQHLKKFLGTPRIAPRALG